VVLFNFKDLNYNLNFGSNNLAALRSLPCRWARPTMTLTDCKVVLKVDGHR